MQPERRCEVRLLGGFSVRVDSSVVSADAWRSRRGADLVKLLALAPGHRLHRDHVTDALWPNLTMDAAAANLRKALHFARRALGATDAIVSDGALLALWPMGDLVVDVTRFERAAIAALTSMDPDRCRQAAQLCTGELLPADRYEPWVAEAATVVRQRLAAVLGAGGEWERVLELDETDEMAHRSLMQRHLDRGERREAIRQFERLRDALREHIGVGPDAATVAVYEKVLALEGHEPPSAAERTAGLLANGLVAWSRGEVAEAERLARDARGLAIAAQLGHELGEASSLLALVGHARGRWHEFFRAEFAASVRQPGQLEAAVYDAHLCFQEFYLHGPTAHRAADRFGKELLTLAERARSAAGQALAVLLVGESALLSGELEEAAGTLRRAADMAHAASSGSTESIALERLAETEVALGRREAAGPLLERARPLAESSGIPSHLVVRVFGVQVLAAANVVEKLAVVTAAEHWVADAPRVCEPCSMTFRVEAARTCARAGDLARARRHLAETERISRLWQSGPWNAAIWEIRAELRSAQGERDRAAALFLEAADIYAQFGRPLDEKRCTLAAAG